MIWAQFEQFFFLNDKQSLYTSSDFISLCVSNMMTRMYTFNDIQICLTATISYVHTIFLLVASKRNNTYQSFAVVYGLYASNKQTNVMYAREEMTLCVCDCGFSQCGMMQNVSSFEVFFLFFLETKYKHLTREQFVCSGNYICV